MESDNFQLWSSKDRVDWQYVTDFPTYWQASRQAQDLTMTPSKPVTRIQRDGMVLAVFKDGMFAGV